MTTYGYHDSWLLPSLAVISRRPGMFLSDERVRTFATYINGYTQAREDLGVPPYGEGEGNLLSEFDEWLASKLKSEKLLTWSGRVEEADSSDRIVHTFCRFFEEFLSEKGMNLPDPDVAASMWPAHPWPIQPWPPKQRSASR